MGTTLFSLGLEGGGCPELLNLEQAGLVTQVHRGFVDAGADVILTNTFGGNRRRLALHGLQNRVAELNTAAVRVARRVAGRADRSVAVAGSIGPTGDLFEPLGPLTHDHGVEVFAEQAAALAEAGADVLWVETLSSWEELAAATEAVFRFGLPFVTTLSFDTNGRTMMGITPASVGEWWLDQAVPPDAIGANCGIGPGDAVACALDITGVAPEAVVVTKANCGMPLFETDRLVYPVGPDGMEEYVELAIRSGARIIGACCGSTPDHVAAIRAAVDGFGVVDRPERAALDRPERAEIEERLDASRILTLERRHGGRRARS